jgi:hypothetical protein
MNKVTKTADLSEYTDAQIELMFQSAKIFDVLKSIVNALKNQDVDKLIGYGSGNFGSNTPSKQMLNLIKMACANEKLDSKIFDL